MTSKRGAIILGAHLTLIQELGKAGVECIAMDFQRAVSTYSKYSTYQRCPDPMVRMKEAVDYLYGVCRKQGDRPVLFLISDSWTTALAKHKDMFLEVSEPCVAEYDTVDLLMDKDRFCRRGWERKFMTPRPWTLEEALDLTEGAYPIIAKARVRRAATNEDWTAMARHMDRLRAVPLHSPSELQDLVEREKDILDHLAFQEYIRGMTDQMYSVGVYLDRSSKILAQFCGHKIRGYPADHGDCLVYENTDVPDELIDNIRKIVAELNLTGLAEFEYKKDSVTGEFKLIEINPRAWLWIGLAPAGGVNLPLIAYEDLTGTYEGGHNQPFPGKVKFFRILDDLPASMYRYKTDYPAWSKTFTEWLRDLRADRKMFLEFNSQDRLVSAIFMMESARAVALDVGVGMKRRIKSLMGRPRPPEPEGASPPSRSPILEQNS